MKTKITKTVLLVLLALLQITDIFGQCATTVMPGNGSTSGNGRSPNARFRNGRGVYLISATEMATSGYATGTVVTGIGWLNTVAPGVTAAGNLKVYLQNTSDASNLKSTTYSTAISGMTMVHSAATTMPNTLAFNITTFSGGSAFTYTGGAVYVAFDWDYCSGTLSTTQTIACINAGPTLSSLQNGGACATLTAMTGGSLFRPDTKFFATCTANDAQVVLLYSFGKLANVHSTNHAVRANIKNNGTATITGLVVNLSVSGLTTFSDNQTIASLAPGVSTTVTFASYTPSGTGTNTVTVSVPNDDNNANNSKTITQDVTTNQIAYKDASQTNSGGVGFTGGTGAFVGKFFSATGGQINEVQVDFSAVSGQTYRLGIYADNAGVPQLTPLYTDAVDRTVSATGTQFLTLASPVTVPAGNFYLGVRQTGTINASFAYTNEAPLRANNFFYTSPLPEVTAWTELSSNPALTFRFNIVAQFFVPTAPNCVVSMSPANNNIGTCFVTPTLSWASGGGAPTGYDVYFGTSSTPPLVSTNQAGLTFTPTGLSPSTQYYWKVVAKNGIGDATGCSTLTFTTGANSTTPTISPAIVGLCGGSPAVATVFPASGATYLWAPGGQTTQTKTISTVGTYTCTVTQGTCVQTVVTSAIVESNPSAGTTTATPAAICGSGNSVLVSTSSNAAAGSYCTPSTVNGGAAADEITLFQATGLGINYSTAVMTASPGYVNQLSTVGNAVAGSTYAVNVNQQDAGDAFKIWIDLDNNGSFEDAGELLATSIPAASQVVNITIPTAITNGNHRLRIRNTFDATNTIASTTSCTNGNTYGVTIDFTLAVTGGVSSALSYSWSPTTFLGATNTATVNATAINTTTTYTVTSTAFTGCSVTGSATVTINANPTVNAGGAIAAICQGSITAALGGSFGGGATSAVWTDGGAGGSFANNAGSTPGTATYTASNSSPASVTLTLTTAGGSCGTVLATKVLTVNPKPVGSTSNTTICSGTNSNVVLNSTLTGTTFAWAAANQTGVTSGFSAGSGSPIAQMLTNASNSANSVVRYTVTPTSSAGCVGSTFIADVAVKPTPMGSTSGDETFCDGGSTSVTFTSTAPSTTFAYVGSASSVNLTGYSASGSGGSISDIIFNSGTTTETVTYVVTPTANGCIGGDFNYIATVGATPLANNFGVTTLCNGDTTDIDVFSTLVGSDFTWTSNVSSGIASGNSNCGGACGGTITDYLINGAFTDAVIDYTVSTTSALGCPGADMNISVTLHPALGITLPAPISTTTDAGVCTAVVNYSTSFFGLPAPTASYTMTGATVGSGTGNGSGLTYNLGVTNVSISGTNSCGTVNGPPLTITVTDVTNPTISAPSSVNATTNTGCTATGVSLGSPITADNCSVASVSNDAPSAFPFGTTVVTWTVIDGSGNSATDQQTVLVTDNVNPTITAPADVTVNADNGMCSAAGVALGSPTTADNCGVFNTSNNGLTVYPVGTTVVTWIVTDIHGNSSSAPQNVTVVDNQFPIVTPPADIIMCSAGASAVSIGSASFSDNCMITSNGNNAPAIFPIGTTVVVWTATDNHGHTTNVNQNVTLNQIPVTTVNPQPQVICNGANAGLNLSSTVAGAIFTWTTSVVSGSMIGNNSCSTSLCGNNIADILTNVGTTTGAVGYAVTSTSSTGCASAVVNAVVTIGVTPATPGAISGPSVVCGLSSANYSIAAVPDATQYVWTVPAPMTIVGASSLTPQTLTTSSTSIVATVPAGTLLGNVTVTAGNSCGTSAAQTLAITKKPATPGAISGPTSTCALSTASWFISPVFGAASYAWTVPAGMTITLGAGSTMITVSIASTFIVGQVKVSAVNACGSIPGAALTVTGNVPATPLYLYGPANVCGLTSTTYSVSVTAAAGATGYAWTVPSWMSITSGAGTSLINVNIIGTPVSGATVTVAGTNVCGTGSAKVLTMSTSAIQPASIGGPANTCSLTTAVYTCSTVAGGVSYQWTPALGQAIISGQGSTQLTVSVAASSTTTTGTSYLKVVSVNACGVSSAVKQIVITRCLSPQEFNNGTEADEDSYSSVYPNPTASDFSIDVRSVSEKVITLEVYDILGNLVSSNKHNLNAGVSTLKTNIENSNTGMYFVRIVGNGTTLYSQTVIKQ